MGAGGLILCSILLFAVMITVSVHLSEAAIQEGNYVGFTLSTGEHIFANCEKIKQQQNSSDDVNLSDLPLGVGETFPGCSIPEYSFDRFDYDSESQEYISLPNYYYTMESPTNDVTNCGGEVTASRGYLTSPNFPAAYCLSAQCTWNIRAPPNAKIHLYIQSFNIERDDEFRVVDHAGGRVQLFERIVEPQLLISIGNELLVNFTAASEYYTKPGFSLVYQMVEGGETVCNTTINPTFMPVNAPYRTVCVLHCLQDEACFGFRFDEFKKECVFLSGIN